MKTETFKGVKMHFAKRYVAGKHKKTHTYVVGHWDGDGGFSDRSVTGMTKRACQKKLVSKLKKKYPKSFR